MKGSSARNERCKAPYLSSFCVLVTFVTHRVRIGLSVCVCNTLLWKTRMERREQENVVLKDRNASLLLCFLTSLHQLNCLPFFIAYLCWSVCNRNTHQKKEKRTDEKTWELTNSDCDLLLALKKTCLKDAYPVFSDGGFTVCFWICWAINTAHIRLLSQRWEQLNRVKKGWTHSCIVNYLG